MRHLLFAAAAGVLLPLAVWAQSPSDNSDNPLWRPASQLPEQSAPVGSAWELYPPQPGFRNEVLPAFLNELFERQARGEERPPVVQQQQGDRDEGDIAILALTSDQLERLNRQPDLTGVAGQFYRSHKDNYDVLVFWSSEFLTERIGAGAFYAPVSNNVTGINARRCSTSGSCQIPIEIFSQAGFYGSRRLNGVVLMNNLHQNLINAARPYRRNPYDIMGVVGQELGHQYGVQVRFKRPDGSLSTELLGRDNSHYSFYANSDASPLEGNRWEETQPGRFRARAVFDTRFNHLDQYIFGLRSPEETSPLWFIRNPRVPNRSRNPSPASPPLQWGEVIALGEKVDVPVSAVVAAEGQRTPTVDKSPKYFKQAWIYLSPQGRGFTPAEINTLNNIREEWLDLFYNGMDRRGRVIASLDGRDEYPVFDLKIFDEGWTAENPFVDLISGGALVSNDGQNLLCAYAGDAPGLVHTNLKLKTDRLNTGLVRMSVPKGAAGAARLWWTNSADENFGEAKSVLLPVIPDGQFHTYAVNLRAGGALNGVIYKMRITPAEKLVPGEDGTAPVVRYDLIELTAKTYSDKDSDSFPDEFDNCPDAFNVDQGDDNADGKGNLCDPSWSPPPVAGPISGGVEGGVEGNELEPGGCNCALPGRGASAPWGLLALAAAIWILRRRM
ncbi:MAG: hypothetical protein GMKNLPBB_00882 [Myxococcota bacterium]|nr:hypothetical protein [Myxococcota bacterium]